MFYGNTLCSKVKTTLAFSSTFSHLHLTWANVERKAQRKLLWKLCLLALAQPLSSQTPSTTYPLRGGSNSNKSLGLEQFPFIYSTFIMLKIPQVHSLPVSTSSMIDNAFVFTQSGVCASIELKWKKAKPSAKQNRLCLYFSSVQVHTQFTLQGRCYYFGVQAKRGLDLFWWYLLPYVRQT